MGKDDFAYVEMGKLYRQPVRVKNGLLRPYYSSGVDTD